MTIMFRTSTASQSFMLGPFIDSADGVTPKTALTIANTDIRLSKNGGAFGNKTSGGGTTAENGWYTVTLDATDTNTVGRLLIACKVAGALTVYVRAMVLPANAYDGMVLGTGVGVRANIQGVSGSAVSTTTAQLGVNAVQAGGTAWASGAITAASIASSAITSAKIATGAITSSTFAAGAINAAAIAANAITNSQLADGAVTAAKFAASAITSTVLAAGAITNSIFASNAISSATITDGSITSAKIATDAITSTGLAASAADKVRDSVWAQTLTEPSAAPTWSSTVKQALEWVTALARNKVTQSTTTQTLVNDAESGNVSTAAVSDAAGVFTRAKWS